MDINDIDELKKYYKINKIEKDSLKEKNVFEDEKVFKEGFWELFFFRGCLEDIFNMSQEYYEECSNITQIREGIYQISIQPNYIYSEVDIYEVIKKYPNTKAVGFFSYARKVYEVFSESGYSYFTSKKFSGYFLDDYNWFNEYSVFDEINYRGIDVHTGEVFYVHHTFGHSLEWNKCDYVIKINNELFQIEEN